MHTIVKASSPVYNNDKNIEKLRTINKCAKQVFQKRSKIYDSSIWKTCLSTAADLSTDFFLYKSYESYDMTHFVEQHMLTYLTTSILYFVVDCIIEFNNCDDEKCNIN